MSVLTVMQFIVNIIIMIVLLTIMILGVIWLFKDKGQNQHSVLRNFPVLGRIRYISEKIGPELRQYFFANDNEGKPFSRSDYKNIVLAGKYKSRMTSFGTGKDYEEGFYIKQLNYISIILNSFLHFYIILRMSAYLVEKNTEKALRLIRFS